ncbi:alpha/beta hydrolase [Arenibacter certesii]|nr:alpha/beta hydrolase-fold protein [Arenibacter certesii]
MRILLISVIALTLWNCEAKKTPHAPPSDNQIVIGVIDSIYSDNLQEQQKFWVHVPNNLGQSKTTYTKYPVLYLLDGEAHFYSLTGMVNQLSAVNGNDLLPEMIVVGITNNDRMRDLSPTHVAEVFGDSISSKTSGGGKNFLTFIEKELIPHIEEKYPASSYRTFVGHSLGGLIVIDALVDRPEIFSNYVAIDPSLWWDNQELLEKYQDVISNTTYSNKALYVGVANTMEEEMSIEDVVKDTTETTVHIRSILKFVNAADSLQANGLHFKWKYYENDTHGSVPLIAEYDAIRFLFPWYSFKGADQFLKPNSNLSIEEMISMIDVHYKLVSSHFGYESLPAESFINSLGYGFMRNNHLDKANTFFKMNIQNYPNSSNVYDSMGDFYLAQHDSIKALEFFNKALEVGENDYSQVKIDRLNENLKIK